MFEDVVKLLNVVKYSADVVSYFVKYDEEKKEKQILIICKDSKNEEF